MTMDTKRGRMGITIWVRRQAYVENMFYLEMSWMPQNEWFTLHVIRDMEHSARMDKMRIS